MSRSNKFQLRIGNMQYSVNLSEKAHGLYDVKVNDETYSISIVDLLSPSLQAAGASGGAGVSGIPGATAIGGDTIKAAMPGTVMTVKVKVGDVIKPGDIVLTLETMKMENPIKSTKGGKVKEISVQPGKFVNVGDRLMVIE
jgi:biotin carboxyl carrier protein